MADIAMPAGRLALRLRHRGFAVGPHGDGGASFTILAVHKLAVGGCTPE